MIKVALIIRLQVLKFHFDCLIASNFRSEKLMEGRFDSPLGRSRVNPLRIRLSQSPSHIHCIRSSTPGTKDFSLLQRAKFTGGSFLLGRDSCLIVRCPMRSEIVCARESRIW